MVLEKTSNEVILRLPLDFDNSALQKVMNYIKYKEIIKKSKGTELQAEELARESKERWWAENKNRYLK
jgi:hypothetical protein